MTSTELTKEYLAELLALADAVNVAIVARLRACSAPFVAGDRSCGQALAAEQVAEEALADAMKPAIVREMVTELRRSLAEGKYLREELASARTYRVDACRFGVLRRLFSFNSAIVIANDGPGDSPFVTVGTLPLGTVVNKYASGGDERDAVDAAMKRMMEEGKAI